MVGRNKGATGREETDTLAQQTLALVREAGVLRARDLAARGISPTHLQRLYERGLLLRSGRGIYLPADAEASALDENGGLVEVSLRSPAAVICLLSALQFHGLTTQAPIKSGSHCLPALIDRT